MYIKQITKQNSKSGKKFYQYQLVQSMRIDGKPRQKSILYLGSNPILSSKEKRKIVGDILEGLIYRKGKLFEEDKELINLAKAYYQQYLTKYEGVNVDELFSFPSIASSANYQLVDINKVDVSDVRSLGGERLCMEVLKKIGLGDFLDSKGWTKIEVTKGLISIISRALYTSSEHMTARYLQENSSLPELFNMLPEQMNRHWLYRLSDRLYENKEEIEQFFYGRLLNMFDLEDKLLIFDLSNSHFAGRKQGSELAKYGRNKQKRNDCLQVVFTAVVNRHGFIRHSREYPGNMADAASLDDMIADLKKYSPKGIQQTVVMDAGIASEGNLAKLRADGLYYVCVSRSKLTDYKADLTDEKVTVTDKDNSLIELQIIDREGLPDTWMYVKSERKALKEKSMEDKLHQRFLTQLEQVGLGIHKKWGTKKLEKVGERIGRIKEKNKSVHGHYKINLEHKDGIVTNITWKRVAPKQKSKNTTHGEYFIRTNYDHKNETQLWEIYNTIREVEATFKCLKSHLNIRPIHHQKDSRVKAHIFLTVLAYQLVNTIRYMLKQHNIPLDWNNIRRIMNTQTIQTVELKTEFKTIGIRKPSRPNQQALNIYKACSISSMMKNKQKYVVYH